MRHPPRPQPPSRRSHSKAPTRHLQAAIEQARYGVHPASNLPDASSTYVANNPAQRYQATFTPGGLVLAGRDAAQPWRVGVTLSAIGRAGVDASVSPGAVTADGARVTLAQRVGDVALTEWFNNTASGLEQGVTIDARPAADAAGPLRLTWQVRGVLRPVAGAAGQAVTSIGPDQSAVL